MSMYTDAANNKPNAIHHQQPSAEGRANNVVLHWTIHVTHSVILHWSDYAALASEG